MISIIVIFLLIAISCYSYCITIWIFVHKKNNFEFKFPLTEYFRQQYTEPQSYKTAMHARGPFY